MSSLRRMIVPVALACALCGSTAPAFADVIAGEDFGSYTVGDGLNGGTGGDNWTTGWSTIAQATCQILPGGDQAARVAATAEAAMTRRFAAETGPVYIGMSVRVSDFTSANFIQLICSDGVTGYSPNNLSVGIRNAAGAPFFARVGTATTNSTTHGAANDTTYRLVAKFSKDGSAGYNRTDLWVDAAAETEAAATSHTGSSTGLSQLTLFSARTYNFSGGDTLYLDDILVGDSFDSVVPEPACLALLLSAGGVLLRRRRR